MIEVANLRKTRDGMICDQTSPLGNPFRLCRGPAGMAERVRVVKLYGCYLHLIANQGHEPIEAIKAIKDFHPVIISARKKPDRSEFVEALDRLEWVLETGYLRLLCWCAPLPCHCDRIKDFLLWKKHGQQQKSQISQNICKAEESPLDRSILRHIPDQI